MGAEVLWDAMRVAIVARAIHPRDGVGASIRGIDGMLRALGHSVAYYVEESPPPDLAGATVVDLALLIRAARDRRSHPFFDHDLYVFEYPTWSPILEAHRLLLGKTRVFHYHGITPPAHATHPATRTLLERSLERLGTLASAHMVIAHSRFALDELTSRVPIASQRLVSIPIALAPDTFAPVNPQERQAARRELGLDDRFTLLYVGRLAPHKNVPLLVDGLAAALQTGRAAASLPMLLLAGDDRRHGYALERVAALERARRHGITGSIRWMGSLDDAGLERAYRAADALVTASEHEGFCVPVAHALAFEMPCIVARAGALPETAGDAALYFERGDARALGDAIARLVADETLRRTLAGNARAQSRRFHPDTLAPALNAALGRALSIAASDGAAGGPPEPDLLGAAAGLDVEPESPAAGALHRRLVSWLRRRMTLPLGRLVLGRLQDHWRLTAEIAAAENARLRARIDALERRLAALESGRLPARGAIEAESSDVAVSDRPDREA